MFLLVILVLLFHRHDVRNGALLDASISIVEAVEHREHRALSSRQAISGDRRQLLLGRVCRPALTLQPIPAKCSRQHSLIANPHRAATPRTPRVRNKLLNGFRRLSPTDVVTLLAHNPYSVTDSMIAIMRRRLSGSKIRHARLFALIFTAAVGSPKFSTRTAFINSCTFR